MKLNNNIENILPDIKNFCYATSHSSKDFCSFMKDIKFTDITKFNELSNLLADKILLFKKDIDVIVSVPKFIDEQNEIDFSLKIAEIVSKKISVKYCSDLIVKTKKTKKLKSIPKELREKEIENSFELNKKYDLTNKKVCVVDDVYSSGYTLKEIIKTLSKQIDVSKISIAVLVIQK